MSEANGGPEAARLTKGENVGLTDLDAELGAITVVLETGDSEDGPIDADVSVLLLGADGRVRTNDDLIFYNQPIALDGAIHLREKLRTTDDDRPVSADVVTLRLDDVPEEVDRIMLTASLDPALDITFGVASLVRLRVQRTSDARDLVFFDIADARDERALLFAECYRRRGEWRLRAIGQGYAGGLASLIADFGIDVAAEPTEDAEHGGDTETAEPVAAAPSPEASVTVRRTVRAPKLPADWNKTLPSDDGLEWQPARLFPVAGIGGAEEQERRATSALLAVMSIVRDLGRDLTYPLGAPAGAVETFTEVTFGREDEAVRPDGVVRVRRGQREWTALVEVKSSDGRLTAGQLEAYLDVARARKFDAVLTISNELSGLDGDHPVPVDRRKIKRVALHHLAWDEIRARVRILAEHRGLADPTQQKILEEFLRYMNHPRSGMRGFTDMGPQWVRVREAVKARTQRASERSTAEVSARFEQLVRHTALHLSGLLGVDVQVVTHSQAPDVASRCHQLADSGLMFGSIKIPGTVAPIVLSADIRTEKVLCSVTTTAPRDGRPLTRINWLLRQIPDAREQTRVVALLAGSREASNAALIRQLRADSTILVPDDGRDIRGFRVEVDGPLGSKRSTGSGTVIDSVVNLTTSFYGEVVQNLRPWSARPVRPPKLAD